MAILVCPCGTCPDQGCGNHSNCDKYKGWKEEHDRQRMEHYQAMQISNQIDENWVIRSLKSKRRNGR